MRMRTFWPRNVGNKSFGFWSPRIPAYTTTTEADDVYADARTCQVENYEACTRHGSSRGDPR